jgi:poly(3-hydroxybutyrate) depolymerase
MSRHPMTRYWTFAAGALIGLLSMSNVGLGASPREAPVKSAGCMPGAVAHAGLSNLTAKDGNSRSRTYLLQAPSAYSAARAYPLIFVFHAAGGNSKQSYSWGLQNVAGASDSGIFVFPDGIPFKNYGIGWDDTATGYDLPFFDTLLKDVAGAYCVDLGRVFVAGFSWGGDFVTALACNRGDAIRAIAANSTDDEFKDTSNYLTYQNLPCTSHRHPPVRFQHALGGDKSYPAPLFATTSKLFQYLNACGPTSSNVPPTNASMSCDSYNSCASEYIECTFDTRIGHTLPPNWAEETWAFFSKF